MCPKAAGKLTPPRRECKTSRAAADSRRRPHCTARHVAPGRAPSRRTGNSGASRTGSDATHAWIQLYIPDIGWKGFDPTNGVLPRADRVRVAHGRHLRDATPMSATLYGKANETLTVDVEVTDALQATRASVLQAT